MPRPVTIDDETILAAARSLFLERGVRATTAEIARKAGVSQGILFKRYKTKHALFHAAMDSRIGGEPAARFDLTTRVGKGTVRETLTDFGASLIGAFLQFIPFMMMAWSNKAVEGQPRRAKMSSEKTVRTVRQLADYLAAEARIGRVGKTDFEAAAQSFVGALWTEAFLDVTRAGPRGRFKADRAVIARFVDALWTGLKPK